MVYFKDIWLLMHTFFKVFCNQKEESAIIVKTVDENDLVGDSLVKNNLEVFSFGKNAPPGYEKEESDQSKLKAKYLTDQQMIKKFNFLTMKRKPSYRFKYI
jgi:hypothetical protein